MTKQQIKEQQAKIDALAKAEAVVIARFTALIARG